MRHVTDVTNASRTLLYNIVKGEWDSGVAAHLRYSRRACCRKWCGRANKSAR